MKTPLKRALSLLLCLALALGFAACAPQETAVSPTPDAAEGSAGEGSVASAATASEAATDKGSKLAASSKSQGSRKPAKGSTRRSNHHYGKKKK